MRLPASIACRYQVAAREGIGDHRSRSDIILQGTPERKQRCSSRECCRRQTSPDRPGAFEKRSLQDMKSPLHILHLEDDCNDAALVQSALEADGILW